MDFNEYLNSNRAEDSLWGETYNARLSDLITEARLYAGLTQAQLAERMGIKQPSVARAESGRVVPSHEFLKRVARAVGTELVAPRFSFMDKNDNDISFASSEVTNQSIHPLMDFPEVTTLSNSQNHGEQT